MKNQNQYKNMTRFARQGGFIGILELLILLGILAILALVFLVPWLQGANERSQVTQTELQISLLQRAMSECFSYANTYTGCDQSALVDRFELISADTLENTFSGTNSVAPGSNPRTEYTVTVDGFVSDGLGERMLAAYEAKMNERESATYGGGTLTLNFSRL